MFDKNKLNEIISAYKAYFPDHWKDEMYKWKAVKHFQDHWDINAPDLKAMLESSLGKTYNLLTSGYYYPRLMLIQFAEEDPEATRAALMSLFDETRDLSERIAEFQAFADDRRDNHNNSGWKNHYQNTNAISTYLWLRYPDKYYIYKYSEYRVVAAEISSDYMPKKSSDASVVAAGYRMYDEVCEYVKQDSELVSLLNNAITDDCYPDKNLKTLTIDIGFFISRYYTEEKKPSETDDWWPSLDEYTPGLSTEKWLEILKDSSIIGPVWGNSLAEYYEIGGEATCTQVGKKFNRDPSSVSGNLTNLAKKIHTITNCPLYESGDGRNRYWPILFIGRNASSEEAGSYVWKLRSELYDALSQFGIWKYLSKPSDTAKSVTTENCNYWWLNASPKIWSFSNIAVGEEVTYSLYNDNGNKRKVFRNFLDAKAGDYVIGYEANPVKQIVALARIVNENDGKDLPFVKTEGLTTPIDYAQLKALPELENMEFFTNPNGSLFRLTKTEYDVIMDLIRESNPVCDTPNIKPYTKDDFLREVYMTEDRFDALASLLNHKKNVILQGAPGVGKTFSAKRLAYAIMGKKDDSKIKMVQFHQNYSYEDFIMGYKPEEEGFKLTNGVFYQFCQTAANHPGDKYFFIIDEINRGNLSKIFGELLMLIEKDYRGTSATLAYSGTSFSVPENLYIIGMMNTADRSLALIDYALRRRFSFFEMEPGFNSEGFKKYQEHLANETFDALIDCIKQLNQEIRLDDSLGPGFRIGHSYFCGQEECTNEWMREVVNYDLIPMLHEYWFDDKQKIQRWENALTGVFND